MPSGITLGDLTLTRISAGDTTDFSDLLITVDGGISIQIENHFYNPTYAVETLVFNDTSTLDLTTLSNVDAYLTSGDDNFGSTDTSDYNVYGLDGNDYIYTVMDGTHTIDGGNGNDTINGGAGNDTLTGGSGTDTLTYADATSAITISLATGTAQTTGGSGSDTISGFENLTGSAYNDTLTGDSSANVIQGGDGNDSLTGGSGTDTVTMLTPRLASRSAWPRGRRRTLSGPEPILYRASRT